MKKVNDAEMDKFFHCLGDFVATASVLESNLSILFRELLGLPDKVGRAVVGCIGTPALNRLATSIKALAASLDLPASKLAFVLEICAQAEEIAFVRNIAAHQHLGFDDQGATVFTDEWTAKSHDKIKKHPLDANQLTAAITYTVILLDKIEMFKDGSWETPASQERLEGMRVMKLEHFNMPKRG